MEEIPEINSYFQGINRGSLLYPNDIITNFVLFNYVVIDKLIKNNSFLYSLNQRKLAMHITLNALADNELLFNVDTCDKGHNLEKIQRMFVWSSTNALLNNFCSRENNNITINKLNKKENLQYQEGRGNLYISPLPPPPPWAGRALWGVCHSLRPSLLCGNNQDRTQGIFDDRRHVDVYVPSVGHQIAACASLLEDVRGSAWVEYYFQGSFVRPLLLVLEVGA